LTEFILNNPHPLEVNETRIPLSFHISATQSMDKNTIPIVVLHGYGEYSNSSYIKSLHKSLTSKYNVAIITVNYTGTFSKNLFNNFDHNKPYDFLNYSLEIIPGENKKRFLQILYTLLNNNEAVIKMLKQRGVIETTNFQPYRRTIELLIFKLERNNHDGINVMERLFEIGFKEAVVSILSDTKGDHQDFGVIQTIDVLTAIAHIKNLDTYKNLNWSKLSLVGDSHGGYLASMCDKFAPNTFHIIGNNAGWINCSEKKILSNNTKGNYLNLKVDLNENSYWSTDPKNINFFSSRHNEIRSLTNSLHIKEQLNQTKNILNKMYIFSHTLNDTLISIDTKDSYIDTLKSYYTNIIYIRLDNTNQ